MGRRTLYGQNGQKPSGQSRCVFVAAQATAGMRRAIEVKRIRRFMMSPVFDLYGRVGRCA
jgi:hypothetical protein